MDLAFQLVGGPHDRCLGQPGTQQKLQKNHGNKTWANRVLVYLGLVCHDSI